MTKSEIFQKICDLTSQLTSPVSSIGDWKVAKCYEYSLAGLEAPYDINELHANAKQFEMKLMHYRKQRKLLLMMK